MTKLAIGLLACLLAAMALALLGGGVILLAAGGSPYYLAAGAALLATAVALVRQQPAAIAIYGSLLLVTLGWSLWEVGLDGWALAPRLLLLTVVGLLFLPSPLRRLHPRTSLWIGGPVMAIIAVVALAAGLSQRSAEPQRAPVAAAPSATQTEHDPTEWHHWGKTSGGQRYLATDQINTDNAHQLELAWRFDAELPAPLYPNFEATPLLADGRLYMCLKPGIVAALDPDTGEQ